MFADFKPGDIILAHGNSLDNKFLELRYQSHFSHAAVGYDDLTTIEMTDINLSSLPYLYYGTKAIQVIRFHYLDDIQRKYFTNMVSQTILTREFKFDKLGVIIPWIYRPGYYTCLSYIDYLFSNMGMRVDTQALMQGDFKMVKCFQPTVVYDYRDEK